jgi:type II secretory pathway pseudopilin PulG
MMSGLRRRQGQRLGAGGFTLVEILATFVLIAIILPVVMSGISMASKLASQAKRRVAAGVLAQQVLSEFVLSGDYEDGDQEGVVSSDNTDYVWRLEVMDWEEEDSMQQLDMSVTWEDSGAQENTVVLSTLVYTGSEE